MVSGMWFFILCFLSLYDCLFFLSPFTGSVAMLVRACLCAYTVLYDIFTFSPVHVVGTSKKKYILSMQEGSFYGTVAGIGSRLPLGFVCSFWQDGF